MRVSACTLLTIATAFWSAPLRGQKYVQNYRVCIQTYSIGVGSINCSFTSLAQCAASASGRSAQCYDNPYFAQRDRKPFRPRGVL